MPEANQYTFKHREIVQLLIKEAGIHEGKWFLMVSFGFAPGNFGPDAEQLSPGTVVAVNQIGISKAVDGVPPEILVDAAEVNPPPKSKGREAR